MAAAPQVQQDERPYYARRNEVGYYTWEGEQLPSVTTVLGSAPGSFLVPWYGKMAAMKCAAHLVQAGYEPPERDERLEEFCAGLLPRSITKAEAFAELWNWQRNMIEAERYRDHKGRIGSVVHHATYRHALGDRVAEDELHDYLFAIARDLDLWREHRKKDPDFRASDSMLDELAGSAHAYALSAFEWIERFQPDWEMIGQEAVVIRPDEGDGFGYAGTMDFIARMSRTIWERHEPWPWEGQDAITVVGDFKTSNSLAHRSVQAQIEAYRGASFIGLINESVAAEVGKTVPMPETAGLMALHIGPHASMSTVTDEFGTLETKAKQIGAKAYTWDPNPETFEAFLGLVRWFRWTNAVPRAHQMKQRAASAPKPQPGAPRPAPF